MSIEPLQPEEGELAPCPFLIGGTRICEKPKFGRHETCITSNCAVIEGIKAQLAHDKQRMVKLPSEDELSEMVRVFLCLPAKETAHGLLKLLKGERA